MARRTGAGRLTETTTSARRDTNPLRSFRERNVRIFFAGFWFSTIGTWSHNTAVVLLIRDLGGDGLELGIAAACQFGPVLVFGLKAGAIADGIDRFRATKMAQYALGIPPLILGIAVLAGGASLWLVYLLTFLIGAAFAFENPNRRAFATELVPKEMVGNILSLNTSVMTSARMIGPALAAVLAATIGVAWVFVLNSATYGVFLVTLGFIDRARFHGYGASPKSPTPVRDGLRAIWSVPSLRVLLVVFALVSTFAYNHTVGLPLLVSDRLAEDPTFYGWLLSVISFGNVIGALVVARLTDVADRFVLGSGLFLGLSLGVLAFTTAPATAMATAVVFGVALAMFANSSTVVVQQRIDPQVRSRALALTSVLFIGSTPIGGPITGIIGDAFGAVAANLYGAVISVGVATAGFVVMARRRDT